MVINCQIKTAYTHLYIHIYILDVLEDPIDGLPVTFKFIKKTTEIDMTLSRVKCYLSTKWSNNRIERDFLQYFRQ